LSVLRKAAVAAISTLLLTVTSQVPASAGETITAAAVPTVNYLSPHPDFPVRTGVDITIELRNSADTDHVVVYDGTTGEELAHLTGAPRMPWRYVWKSVAGSISPNFMPVSTTGQAGALLKTNYRFDDEPPVVDYLGFEFLGGTFTVADGRVGPVGRLVYGVQEKYWTINDVWTIDGVVVPDGEWSYPPRSEPYLARIQVMDGAGNWGERTFSLTVDATGPAVTSVVPANGALVRGSRVYSSLRAVDASGIYLAELVGAGQDGEPPYAASLLAGKDGPRTLTWHVQDKVGNITTVNRTVTVDNTRAKVAFAKAPKHKAKVKGTVKLTASASDRNGVARVQLVVNGKVVATDTKAAYQFSVNTKKYGKSIKIQLRAYDKAGNVSATSTRTWYR
jgi:hypothetical protein